jgi:hypothetical protein
MSLEKEASLHQNLSTEKKGFFSSMFTAFSKIKIGKSKITEANPIIIKNDGQVKMKRFAVVARSVLKSIQEKKQIAKRTKLEIIVDMLMSQKACQMSMISNRISSNFVKSNDIGLKKSVSCPSGLNIMRIWSETINLENIKNTRLSCSCNSNLNKNIKNEKNKLNALSSQSSFESSESNSRIDLNIRFEQPLRKQNVIRRNNGLSSNCNKAIVSYF